MSMGMATHRPMIVVMSASQMPAASCAALGALFSAMVRNTEDGPEQAEQRRDHRNEPQPAQPFRDLLEIAVEQVSDLGPDVFGVASVGLHDIADNGNQRIVALIAHIAHTAAFLMLNVEKVPLEVAPDEMQIQKVPQREVQSRTTDKNQRDAGRAYGRID